MAKVETVKLEKMNLMLMLGGGLYTMWYVSQTIKVTPQEKALIKTLIDREFERWRGDLSPEVLRDLYAKVI